MARRAAKSAEAAMKAKLAGERLEAEKRSVEKRLVAASHKTIADLSNRALAGALLHSDRRCSRCTHDLPRDAFSSEQWDRSASSGSRCRDCDRCAIVMRATIDCSGWDANDRDRAPPQSGRRRPPPCPLSFRRL